MYESYPICTNSHVGTRIRDRRLELGLSELRLAAHLRIEAGRLSAIELGAVRIDAEELYDVAKILGAPISYFFAGLVRL